MALNGDELSVLAYANGFTLWHYKTADPAAVLGTGGYFAGVADMVRPGDMLLANTGDGGGLFRIGDGGTAAALAAD